MRERWMTLRVRLRTDAAPRAGDQIEPDRLIDFIESGEDLEVVGVTPTIAELRSLCKQVRVETGARILDCKQALRACHWDVREAIRALKHQGLA